MLHIGTMAVAAQMAMITIGIGATNLISVVQRRCRHRNVNQVMLHCSLSREMELVAIRPQSMGAIMHILHGMRAARRVQLKVQPGLVLVMHASSHSCTMEDVMRPVPERTRQFSGVQRKQIEVDILSTEGGENVQRLVEGSLGRDTLSWVTTLTIS